MYRSAATAISLFLLASPAMAQGAKAESPAMTLKVRPSGYDSADNENRARQERLARRMEENDFLFRSICVQCGDAWKHNSYAPFDPMRSLSRSGRVATE